MQGICICVCVVRHMRAHTKQFNTIHLNVEQLPGILWLADFCVQDLELTAYERIWIDVMCIAIVIYNNSAIKKMIIE